MSMLKSAVFLDLEGTIIDSMDNPVFLSEHITREWFTNILAEADEFHLFSWAITSAEDVKSKEWLVRQVEETLGIKFKSIVLRDDFFPFFRSRFGHIDFVEFEEICRSLGKETVFQMFIRNIFSNTGKCEIFQLIDDMVDDTILSGIFGRIETISVKS